VKTLTEEKYWTPGSSRAGKCARKRSESGRYAKKGEALDRRSERGPRLKEKEI